MTTNARTTSARSTNARTTSSAASRRRLLKPSPRRLVRAHTEPSTLELHRQLSVVDHSPAAMHRRRFLQGALAVGGATALLPTWLADVAEAGPPLGDNERILVVILMGGGNDGFKMISPLDNATFTGTRDFLADDPATAHSIGNGLYLNQYLPYVKEMWDQGNVATVLGLGNPLDDRSHFSSMASWMAADLTPPYTSGWLGRFFEDAGYDPLGALAVGDGGVPLYMRTQNVMATAISSYGDLFGASDAEWDQRRYRGMHKYAEGSSGLGRWVDLAGDTFSAAMNVAQTVNPAYAGVEGDGIARKLALGAGLINLDVGARVIAMSYGDFDHHDNQAYPYQARMTELNEGLTQFYNRLDPAFSDRVAIMTFSEFGRSFTPNGSAGTDHGTASNVMVLGTNINGGVYGEMPNFAPSALDNWGDVEHTVDFRSYYATAIDGWLGGDSQQVLGRQFEDLGIFPANDEGPPTEPNPSTATLAASCLSNDGRFDVTIVNGGDSATFEVEVTGLPTRSRALASGESINVPITGRRDGTYTIRVLRNGAVIMDEEATVACDPEVQVDSSCLLANGRFDIWLSNKSSTTSNYTVSLTGLADRSRSLAPGASTRVSITGRPDRDYDLQVRRNGELVYNEGHTVACDPVSEPVRVDTSCYSGGGDRNGRVDVHLFNDGSSTATYAVTVGSLKPRSRTIPPGGGSRVTVTGRRMGDIDVAVSRGDTEIHRSTELIDCK